MAIEYVGGKVFGFPGTSSATTISLTDLTGGIASAPSDGDFILVEYAVASSGDGVIGVETAGYTEIFELFADDSGDCNLSANWKWALSDTSVDVSSTAGSFSNGGVVLIRVWRGVDPTTPFDVPEQTALGTDSGIPNPPAITPSTTGAKICVVGAGAGSSDWGQNVFTSSDLSNFLSAGGEDFRAIVIGGGSFDWSSGSFDPAQFGLSGPAADSSINSNASGVLVLRPASGGGTTAPTITTSGTASVSENATLAIGLTATGDPVDTWSISGGDDQAQFEINGTTLRWVGDGTQDFESPGDTGSNNDYVVEITATNSGGSDVQTITVTVTDVAEVSSPAINVDRYDVDVSGAGGTIAITAVPDITRAFVRITGSTKQDSAGLIGNTGSIGPDHAGIGLALTGVDEVTFAKQNAGDTVKLMFEVWSYIGPVGGQHEFVSRQRGSVFLDDVASASAEISGISDRNSCVPLFTGFVSNQTSNNEYDRATASCHLNATEEIVFERGDGVGDLTCFYDVIEFAGSAWSVGCARSANHDTGNQHFTGGEVVTMNQDTDGQSGAAFDVGDWSTAMIIQGTMEGDGGGERGLSDTMMSFLPGPSTSELRCTLDNGNSRNDGVAYAYIIQNDGLIVNRATINSIAEGNNSYGTNLAAPAGYDYETPLEQMSLEWFPGTNGEGTAHLRGALHAHIVDTGGAYQVRHWIHRQGNDVTAAYGFVDLSGLVDSGGVPSDPAIYVGAAGLDAIVLGPTPFSAKYLGLT